MAVRTAVVVVHANDLGRNAHADAPGRGCVPGCGGPPIGVSGSLHELVDSDSELLLRGQPRGVRRALGWEAEDVEVSHSFK